MKPYTTILWDFDGVWSEDVFYKSLSKTHPHVWDFIQTKVWGPEGEGKVEKWMRGQLAMNDINRFISEGTGMDFNTLTMIFLDDVLKMEMETRHIPIVRAVKAQGMKVGMVTNNMDVFDSVTRVNQKLDNLFDGVFNSFTFKKLKGEGLFDIAMQALGNPKYDTTLLIDDSPRARAGFESRGGHTYSYTTFDDFKSWADKNLMI